MDGQDPRRAAIEEMAERVGMHPRDPDWPAVSEEREAVRREYEDLQRRLNRVVERLPPLPVPERIMEDGRVEHDMDEGAYGRNAGATIPFDLANGARTEIAAIRGAAAQLQRRLVGYRGIPPGHRDYARNSYRNGFRDWLPRVRGLTGEVLRYDDALAGYMMHRSTLARAHAQGTIGNDDDDDDDADEAPHDILKAATSASSGNNRDRGPRPPGGHRRDAERFTEAARHTWMHELDNLIEFDTRFPDNANPAGRVIAQAAYNRARDAYTQAIGAQRATAYAPAEGFPTGHVFRPVRDRTGRIIPPPRIPDEVKDRIRKFLGMGAGRRSL